MALNRRYFLTHSGVLTTGALSFLTSSAYGTDRTSARSGQRPSKIIHLVSDGLSAGTLSVADHLSHIVRQRRSTWLELYNNPHAVSGFMDMRSLNSLVTDSSAASSAWGSGSRIVNGAVNILPDGRHLTPLYTLFQQKGWKRGLVTTTEMTHATPAGFAANEEKRSSAHTIAPQYLERRVDLLMGGGLRYFSSSGREDKRDLLADFAAAGYVIAKTAEEIRQAPLEKPWLGLFADSHLPFTVDSLQDANLQKNVPSLAEMTSLALNKLQRESHFILQVEGGRVDHGAHSCDAAATLYDQLAFDEAIDVSLQFQQRHPDTLILITSDHGTGNMGLNGMGDNYGDSGRLLANLTKVKASFPVITRRLEKAKNASEVREIIRELTGFDVRADKAELLLSFVEKKGKTLYSSMNSLNAQLGQLLGDYLGIGWTSGSHTSDYVPVIALGPGAERFRGFIQNTDVFVNYLSLAKIDYRNPSVPVRGEAFNAHHSQAEYESLS